jgi:uncharacterized membrane protein
MGKLVIGPARILSICIVVLLLPALITAQPIPPATQSLSGSENPTVWGSYPELKIMLTAIFIFIGSTAFYISSLICGHNIYRDFSNSISAFLSSTVVFLLFIFSPISFIVLSPDLFMTEKTNDIHIIISRIHSLIYDFALVPFLLSSAGTGMIFGSFTVSDHRGTGTHLRRDTICHNGFRPLKPRPPVTGMPCIFE